MAARFGGVREYLAASYGLKLPYNFQRTAVLCKKVEN